MNCLTNYNNKDIIKQYRPMIYKIANSIYRKIDGDIYNDLIQSGYEALLNAINKYENNKASLTTYIYVSIKRAMYRERNKQVSVVSLPINLRDYLPYLYKAERIYDNEDDIQEYIKKNTTLSTGRIKQLLLCKKCEKSFSLDMLTANKYLRYDNSIDTQLDTKSLYTSLLNSNILTENEKYLIQRYYIDDVLFDDIAKELNKTQHNIHNLHWRLLTKLRKIFKQRKEV